MKKIALISFYFFLCTCSIHAQKINYESSFENAKQKAIAEGKPVAILLLPSGGTLSKEGLKSKEVIEKLNSNFINYQAVWNDTAKAGTIIRTYRILRFPSFVFLDKKTGFLFSEIAPLATPQPILKVLDKALSSSTETSLADYDSIYKTGGFNASFLKKYILRRQSAGLKSNAHLIEQYVSKISVADLDSYDEVLFILTAGPYIDSTAYKLAWLNKTIADSIYKTEPLDKRIMINNTIIANSMDNAVAHKNEKRARAIAEFSRKAWGRIPHEGFRAFNKNMIGYYLGTKDTLSYLSQATNFYALFYMRPSVDSLRKKDSLRLANVEFTGEITEQYDSSNRTVVRQTISTHRKNNPDALELNNVAWRFYRFASKDADLSTAMLWSKRAIELNPCAAYYFTYAHLLYKLDLHAEAEAMMKKGIELGKAEKIPVTTYQDALKKIQSKTL